MIIRLNTAKNNVLEVKEVLNKHSDKPQIDIILRDYIAYQGNAGYSGELKHAIKELAIKACENKRYEISKIIREGIYEILENDCGIIIGD